MTTHSTPVVEVHSQHWLSTLASICGVNDVVLDLLRAKCKHTTQAVKCLSFIGTPKLEDSQRRVIAYRMSVVMQHVACTICVHGTVTKSDIGEQRRRAVLVRSVLRGNARR